jgi:hypothetical protein
MSAQQISLVLIFLLKEAAISPDLTTTSPSCIFIIAAIYIYREQNIP